MKYRKLGKNGPTVSAIGLGAGSATTNFGERDDEVQIDTVHRAIDLGVTLFDTADRYMKGRHERLLGQALKGRRDKVVIASKFGNFDLPGGKKGYNGRPEYVREACDASLKNLGLETIDLYYLHRIDPEVPIEDTVGAMAGLARAGKVRWLGRSRAGPQSPPRAGPLRSRRCSPSTRSGRAMWKQKSCPRATSWASASCPTRRSAEACSPL